MTDTQGQQSFFIRHSKLFSFPFEEQDTSLLIEADRATGVDEVDIIIRTIEIIFE